MPYLIYRRMCLFEHKLNSSQTIFIQEKSCSGKNVIMYRCFLFMTTDKKQTHHLLEAKEKEIERDITMVKEAVWNQ